MKEILNDSSSIKLELTGTFDVAVARNKLRRFAAKHRLPPLLRARAAAAITTIASVVLFRSSDYIAHLHLDVNLLEEDGNRGVKFQFSTDIIDAEDERFVPTEWQLERACDELDITNHDTYDQIIMKIWTNRRQK